MFARGLALISIPGQNTPCVKIRQAFIHRGSLFKEIWWLHGPGRLFLGSCSYCLKLFVVCSQDLIVLVNAISLKELLCSKLRSGYFCVQKF